jgi:DpnII restriction endonuclease
MGRNLEELGNSALKFWPEHIIERERQTSIISRLLATQEKFISILYLADSSPDAWKTALTTTQDLPANLFLKHLMVLSDVGGENLDRFRAEFTMFFPDDEMVFEWNGEKHTYQFQSLAITRSWKNVSLGVDGPSLSTPSRLTPLIEDVAMFLLFAASCTDIAGSEFAKCSIGDYIGKTEELDNFVRGRYIEVSKQTSGAESNTKGQLCQSYVKDFLDRALLQDDPKWDLSTSTIPDISHNDGHTDMSFDIVVKSPIGKYCAIEVSFQVTTNSVIERKGGQSASRQQALHDHGHKIAYVIDGAGNFQRRSAVQTICDHSDCTVSLRDDELMKLVKFLIDNLK